MLKKLIIIFIVLISLNAESKSIISLSKVKEEYRSNKLELEVKEIGKMISLSFGVSRTNYLNVAFIRNNNNELESFTIDKLKLDYPENEKIEGQTVYAIFIKHNINLLGAIAERIIEHDTIYIGEKPEIVE